MASTASIGTAGEAYVKNLLIARGYEVISLQNASGHGIDVVAIKQKLGATMMLVVEVKSTGGSRVPRLSAAQGDLGAWARDRLMRAAAGVYKGVSSADRARAQRMLKLVRSGIPAAALLVGVKLNGQNTTARIGAITRVPPAGQLPRPTTRWRMRFR